MADHPRERAIPYFDLFARLGDPELARLAKVDVSVIRELRDLLESIYQPLAEYKGLLPQLSDAQLSKMLGMPESATHLWRRCSAPQTVRASDRVAADALTDMLGAPDEDVLITFEDV